MLLLQTLKGVVCPNAEPVQVENRWIYHTGSPTEEPLPDKAISVLSTA